ncbi:MAG: NB-ARC domain-containing protein [Actinomycetota bacterium]|nr:NB-ARC domain-containing protein [Actinomycetota bacterium]
MPVPPTPLVGRERDLEEIKTLLGQPEVRILTLAGLGGVGKTRLAIQAAWDAAGLFPDGVVFVGLAPLGNAALVLSTIMQSLGLRETEGRAPCETLCAFLKEKRLLLVLDNFEHVLEAAPEVATLIESCPNLTVLATSRAPLRVRGEQEYPVAPLDVPDPTRVPDLQDVVGAPAVELFVQRARAASPTFELTRHNAASVAAICWRLDGLPLALELAAARVKFLGPTALLSRLDRALEAGGARDLPERQRTMRATLDWSYELLHGPEKELFGRLSVFAGGFELEAAEAVGAAGDVDAADVVLLLGNLVEQSLVVAQADEEEDGIRYGMLEPVRQYATERLKESGEAGEVRRRHAGYYLALAERVGPELRGPEQATWLRRLEAELDNLRAAIGWSLEHGEAEAVARTSYAMWTFWWLSGNISEGRRWMEETLAREPGLSARARAQLLFVAATMGQALGDFEGTWPMIQESLALFRQLGDRWGIGDGLGTGGLIALGLDQPERGLALMQEAVDVKLEVGDRWGAGAMLGFGASVPLKKGDLTTARRLAERGLSLAREVGAREIIYITLNPLAAIALAEGDYEHASRLFAEGLTLSSELGEESSVAYCLEGLATIAAHEGNLEHASRLWGAAEALLEEIEAIAYPHASDPLLRRDQKDAARRRLDKQTWELAWAEGRAMTTEQAIAEALGGRLGAPRGAKDA